MRLIWWDSVITMLHGSSPHFSGSLILVNLVDSFYRAKKINGRDIWRLSRSKHILNGDIVEYLEISKLVTSIAVAVVTVLSRYIYTLLTRNGEKMKIRYTSVELIDKVLNEREWKKRENRIVIEEAFEQLYSKPLNFHEIKALIYSDTPNVAFRTYIKYRPVIEFNERKTKFRYKKGKRPYWPLFDNKVNVPKTITKGLLAYSVFGFPASYAMTWLSSEATAGIATKNMALLWFLDLLVWLVAVIFLVEGLKYQSSEKEIVRDLGDKFQLDNRDN